MPIGLPESINEIRPDAEARRIISGRSSCIFNTPCRQAVYTGDYFEASEINRQILGKGLSKQSFAICSNIRSIPEKPALDSRGLAMQMVYAEKSDE